MSSHRGSIDPMFDVLSHHHCRRLLVALSEQDDSAPSLDLDALGEVVAPNGDRSRVHARMIHCHLPKLDSAGYVRWDRDAGTIAKGPEWVAIESLLRVLLDHRTELPDDLV